MSSYSSIAHSNLEICSPVPWRVYQEILSAGRISARPEILDIGCGKGGILAKATELLDGKGTGVDIQGGLGDRPTLAAKTLEAEGKLEFVFEDARTFLKTLDCSFDLVICIGSSHAVGGLMQVFEAAQRHLKPGGKLLLGELVWKSKPDHDLLSFLDCAEEDHAYSNQLMNDAQAAGFKILQTNSCEPKDFEAYELSLRHSIIDWCQANANDPRSSDFARRSDAWWQAREKWARQAFGFDVLLAARI